MTRRRFSRHGPVQPGHRPQHRVAADGPLKAGQDVRGGAWVSLLASWYHMLQSRLRWGRLKGRKPMTFNPLTDFFVVGDLRDDYGTYYLDDNMPLPFRAERLDGNMSGMTNSKGEAIPAYFIRDGRKKADSFSAYWCSYKKNELHYVTLGTDASFVFTPTMDGCSFGIGQAASDGSVIVSHVNSERLDTATSKAAMIADQRKQLQDFLKGRGGASKLFEPADYRTRKTGFFSSETGLCTTTFGVRGTSGWKFYAHRYRGNAMNAQWVDTITLL
jgi:hypothetical protein